MRRFWLLLLAFVMPLQMSWAAVHFCDDDKAPVAIVAATTDVDQLSHGHDQQESQSQAGGVLADGCCTAAHGCHGLHNLMTQAAPSLFAIPSSSHLAALDQRLAQRQFADRHERPQWSAA